MKDMGEVSSILCTTITKTKNSIKIDESSYIHYVLVPFGMDDCNSTSAPMDYNQKLSVSMSPQDNESKEQMPKGPYMAAIECLLFAAQNTLPDIYYAVNVLSRFSINPGEPHWEAVKRVMRYLKGTIDKGIVYSKEPTGNIIGYCDAD